MNWKLAMMIVGAVSATAMAAPAKPSVARAVKDAKFGKKVDCKAGSPARTANHDALYINTRTKEIISKTHTWLALELECRTFDRIPGYPKAYRKFEGRAQYKSSGGGWSFDSWTEWSTWLEGMPPLDPAVIEAAIADQLTIFDGDRNRLLQTTSIRGYGLRKGEPARWTDVNAMATDVEAEVDEWNGPNLVTSRVVISVRFAQAAPNGPWVASPGLWKSVELSRRKPTEAERKSTVSVIVAEQRRRAAERLASLPVVEIPAFASAAEARAFVYKQLLEAPAPNLESALRRLWSGDPDEGAITAALAGQAAFQQQYCRTAAVKRGRGFTNKDDSNWAEVSVVEAPSRELKDGKPVSAGYRLAKLSLGLVSGERLAALNSYSYDLCAGVLPKANGNGLWKVGDRVEIKYIGSWEPGEIVGIVAGRLSVHDKRRNETKVMELKSIREPQNPAAPEPAAASTRASQSGGAGKTQPKPTSVPFSVGDRVEGNYAGRGKWFKGTVKDFSSARDKVFIKYDDGTSEYLKFELVRKL